MYCRAILIGLIVTKLISQPAEQDQYFDIFKQDSTDSGQLDRSAETTPERKKEESITYSLQIRDTDVEIEFQNPSNNTLHGRFEVECVEAGRKVFSTTFTPVLHGRGQTKESIKLPSPNCEIRVTRVDGKERNNRAKARKEAGKQITNEQSSPSLVAPQNASNDDQFFDVHSSD